MVENIYEFVVGVQAGYKWYHGELAHPHADAKNLTWYWAGFDTSAHGHFYQEAWSNG